MRAWNSTSDIEDDRYIRLKKFERGFVCSVQKRGGERHGHNDREAAVFFGFFVRRGADLAFDLFFI